MIGLARLLGGTLLRATLCAAALVACSDDSDYPSWKQGDSTCPGAFTPGDEDCFESPIDSGVVVTGKEYWTTIDNIKKNSMRPRCLDLNPTGALPTPGQTTIDVATQTDNGRYAPANSGAIWIETSPAGQDPLPAAEREGSVESGEFVRSLQFWAAERRTTLVTYNASLCDQETVDVVASATLEDHSTPHSLVWDGTDYAGRPVPDGEYVLWLEITENEFFPVSVQQRVIFTKGPAPDLQVRENLKGFASINLAYTPGGEGVVAP
jgi:hypothetical protein